MREFQAKHLKNKIQKINKSWMDSDIDTFNFN